MEEIDEKLEKVYEYVRESVKSTITDFKDRDKDIYLEMDKVEKRIDERTKEKLHALKELINSSNTIRHETVISELLRIQKDSSTCSGRCEQTKNQFNDRFKSVDLRLDLEIKELRLRTTELETWRKLNWRELIVYCGAAIIVVIQGLNWIFTHIDKIKPVSP